MSDVKLLKLIRRWKSIKDLDAGTGDTTLRRHLARLLRMKIVETRVVKIGHHWVSQWKVGEKHQWLRKRNQKSTWY